MGSLGADLGRSGPDVRRADRVLSGTGGVFWIVGVYIAFFSSSLLSTLTYLFLVALLVVPVGRAYYSRRDGTPRPPPPRSHGTSAPVGNLLASVRESVDSVTPTRREPRRGGGGGGGGRGDRVLGRRTHSLGTSHDDPSVPGLGDLWRHLAEKLPQGSDPGPPRLGGSRGSSRLGRFIAARSSGSSRPSSRSVSSGSSRPSGPTRLSGTARSPLLDRVRRLVERAERRRSGH